MGQAVPAGDLPSGSKVVPADDLPAQESHWLLKPYEELDRAAYKIGGLVTDAAAKVLPPGGAAAAGYGANLATQAVPTLLGGEVAKLAAPALESAGKTVMQSALKPTLEALRTGKAAKAIQTLLDEGINVTKGGVAELRTRIGALNDEIAEAIAGSSATVDKNKVASALLIPLKKFQNQVNPAADTKAIENAWTEFLAHPLLAGKADIPVQVAQELKQGTYRALGSKAYGEMKGADMEAQKHLARGLKEGVAEAVPAVGPANKAESELLNALGVTERRVLMDSNKNPIGLGALHPETLALWLADRSPLFKSLLARSLYSGSERIPQTLGQITGAGVGAYEGREPRRLQDVR